MRSTRMVQIYGSPTVYGDFVPHFSNVSFVLTNRVGD